MFHMADPFFRCITVHYTVFDADERTLARLRQRRKGEPWLLITRQVPQLDWTEAKQARYFSPTPRPGVLEPTSFVALSPGQALLVLAQSLALPGVLKVQHSKEWQMKGKVSERPVPTNTFFGSYGDERWGRAVDAAADSVRFRLGVDFDPLRDELPAGFSVQQYFELISAALDAQRQPGLTESPWLEDPPAHAKST